MGLCHVLFMYKCHLQIIYYHACLHCDLYYCDDLSCRDKTACNKYEQNILYCNTLQLQSVYIMNITLWTTNYDKRTIQNFPFHLTYTNVNTAIHVLLNRSLTVATFLLGNIKLLEKLSSLIPNTTRSQVCTINTVY